jgi:hypothetical protein
MSALCIRRYLHPTRTGGEQRAAPALDVRGEAIPVRARLVRVDGRACCRYRHSYRHRTGTPHPARTQPDNRCLSRRHGTRRRPRYRMVLSLWSQNRTRSHHTRCVLSGKCPGQAGNLRCCGERTSIDPACPSSASCPDRSLSSTAHSCPHRPCQHRGNRKHWASASGASFSWPPPNPGHGAGPARSPRPGFAAASDE